jgi:hypothetical protein
MIADKIRGYTIFCDEIREEPNGKQIYIGVYNGEIILPGPGPHVLRIVTFLINLFVDTDLEMGEQLTLRVRTPWQSEPIIDANFDLNAFLADSKLNGTLVEGQVLSVKIPFSVTNFAILKEGLISVRGYAQGEELKFGSLLVSFSPKG